MSRKYISPSTRNKREGKRHHNNVAPMRQNVEGFNYTYNFLFSDKIEDWQSKRAGKREYQNLF